MTIQSKRGEPFPEAVYVRATAHNCTRAGYALSSLCKLPQGQKRIYAYGHAIGSTEPEILSLIRENQWGCGWRGFMGLNPILNLQTNKD